MCGVILTCRFHPSLGCYLRRSCPETGVRSSASRLLRAAQGRSWRSGRLTALLCNRGGSDASPELVHRGERPTPRLMRRGRSIEPSFVSRDWESPSLLRRRRHGARDIGFEHCTDCERSLAGDSIHRCIAASGWRAASDGCGPPRIMCPATRPISQDFSWASIVGCLMSLCKA